MLKSNLARLAAGAATALCLTAALALPGGAQQLPQWRHAVINPKSDAGFYLMPVKHGFDRDEGLNIDIIDVKDDQIGLRALLSGEADSYVGSPTGAVAAAAHGADIKLLGCDWVNVPHGLLVRDDIKSVADLAGQSIAASAPGTLPDMLVRAAFSHYNVPISGVELASVGGDLERYDALVSGVVQGAVVSNEYLPLKSSKDLEMLVKGADVLPDLIRTCIFTTGKIVASRHDDVVRFVTAEIKGLRYAVSHRDATIELTREVTGAKPDDPRPAFVFDEAIKPNQVAPDLPIPMDKLAWMQDEMIKLGQLQNPIDLDKLVDPTIRAEALKNIGTQAG